WFTSTVTSRSGSVCSPGSVSRTPSRSRPMLEMAKASLHVKRHLQRRELTTLAVALEVLARAQASAKLDEVRALFGVDGELLSDQEMRSLAFELTRARKVKVCRTKR